MAIVTPAIVVAATSSPSVMVATTAAVAHPHLAGADWAALPVRRYQASLLRLSVAPVGGAGGETVTLWRQDAGPPG
jgi:hypothetical protein